MSEFAESYLPETRYLIQEFNLANWHQDFLGNVDMANFNYDKIRETLPETAAKAASLLKARILNSANYVADNKMWYIWNGKIYKPFSSDLVCDQLVSYMGEQIMMALQRVKEGIETAAKAIKAGGGSEADDKAKAMRASYDLVFKEHKRYRDGILDHTSSHRTLEKFRQICSVPESFFEDDTSLLVVSNGVIDLDVLDQSNKVRLLPHSPSRPVTSMFDAEFIEGAECPLFMKFIAESVIDWETGWFLQKALGASFRGAYKPRAIINMQGRPSCGKSMLVSIFDTLGGGYATTPAHQAALRINGDTNFYQHDLRDKRFLGFSEVPTHIHLDDDFLKALVGGDKLRTRTLHGQPTPWKGHCVPFIASNKPLKYDVRDDAMVERMCPIMFPWSFVDNPLEDYQKKIDRDLETKILDNERSGVLNWILQGIVGYKQQGLVKTKSIIEADTVAKQVNSYAIQFMDMMVKNGYIEVTMDELPKASYASSKDLYSAFGHWCQGMGIKKTPGKISFNNDIGSYFYGKDRSGDTIFLKLIVTSKFKAESMDAFQFSMAMKDMGSDV